MPSSPAPIVAATGGRDAAPPGGPSASPSASSSDLGRPFSLLTLGIFVAYLAVAVVLYAWRGAYFTPDRWLVLLAVGAVLLGRWRGFLRDWVPFVLLIFGYEVLRGVAGVIVGGDAAEAGPYDPDRFGHILVTPLIDADRWLFGGALPVAWLQDRFYEPGVVHWYDRMAVVVYALHFVLPLVFAFLLWLRRRDRFWQFSLAFLTMTYAAFVAFVLFPAAPPWLAERWGLTSGLALPADQALAALVPGEYTNLTSLRIWNRASPNPVAALPSLHAAFPWLVLLFAVRYGGWWGLVFLPYNAALWFSVVYLAQHWVVDILAGIAWATLWFAVTVRIWPRLTAALVAPPGRPRRHLAPWRRSP